LEEDAESLLASASELQDAGHVEDALSRTWQALRLAPGNPRAKRYISRLLRHHPQLASPDRRADIEQLLLDPDIGPDQIAPAGWTLVRLGPPGPSVDNLEEAAGRLENDGLALALLSQAYVSSLPVELAVTAIRRWLLLSEQWPKFPRLTGALIAQAALNGGAWLFDAEESEALARAGNHRFAAAYLPDPIAVRGGAKFPNRTIDAVATQYCRWPYPAWSRLTIPKATTVPDVVERLDGGAPCDLAVKAELLVAGCGTGWEAAYYARRFPDARITAIDVSASSLAIAAERCAGLGIEFRLLDLNQVSSLGRKFDLVICSGVLHHLPDPEAGWAELAKIVKPGGVMKVMLYSRVAWLRVEAAKARIADLRKQQVDDDVLRAARRRLIDEAPQLVQGFYDFFYLAGVHDFLFNYQVDCFDVPRIARALSDFRLELLAFVLPSAAAEAQYRADNPHDPLMRDLAAWAALEKKNPFLFAGMYDFWCRRPA
jgi:SAM-dependent methyltransferase